MSATVCKQLFTFHGRLPADMLTYSLLNVEVWDPMPRPVLFGGTDSHILTMVATGIPYMRTSRFALVWEALAWEGFHQGSSPRLRVMSTPCFLSSMMQLLASLVFVGISVMLGPLQKSGKPVPDQHASVQESPANLTVR